MSTVKSLSKIILHPSYKSSLKDIRRVRITITKSTGLQQFDFSQSLFPQNGHLKILGKLENIKLDPSRGQEKAHSLIFSAYDESKIRYTALEGSAFFTSHALVTSLNREYLPVSFLSFYFYTKSKDITSISEFFKYSEDPLRDSNFDYVFDRNKFLLDWVADGSVALIDGPLIGENLSSYTIALSEELQQKNIVPLFIVKNSDSNLVTTYVRDLNGRFNSDMHWSYNFLNNGERTNFFLYVDQHNSKNAKVFCYLKPFNISPQRIEMHADTYFALQEEIDSLMDLVYYLYLVQGNKVNPQVRPVAIAEKYAREVLKISNSYQLVKSAGLIPTMNQERFGV